VINTVGNPVYFRPVAITMIPGRATVRSILDAGSLLDPATAKNTLDHLIKMIRNMADC